MVVGDNNSALWCAQTRMHAHAGDFMMHMDRTMPADVVHAEVHDMTVNEAMEYVRYR
jgi:hypothetical protein